MWVYNHCLLKTSNEAVVEGMIVQDDWKASKLYHRLNLWHVRKTFMYYLLLFIHMFE